MRVGTFDDIGKGRVMDNGFRDSIGDLPAEPKAFDFGYRAPAANEL